MKQSNQPSVMIIDYGMGNLHSVEKAFERAGALVSIVESPEVVGSPDAVVLPGVGNFGRCIENLRATGLDQTVLSWLEAGKPFFGICLGMQLLFEGSEESDESGLGVINGHVVKIPSIVRVPHMGWNTVTFADRAYGGLGPNWYYFVHSYAAVVEDAAMCEYGMRFTAAIERDLLWATQFHPEKSGSQGIHLLERFVERL